MNKSLSVTAKLTILLGLALIFAATMIALSVRGGSSRSWGENTFRGSDKDLEKTFSVQPGGTLIINADFGDLTVSGSDTPEVSVRVSVRGSEDQMKSYDVSFNQEGNTVRVDARHRGGFFHFFGRDELNVHFNVTVPRSFNLDLHTAGGNIAARDVKGKTSGETSGGNLDLYNLEGTVNISTSGGNIELANSSGDITLETSGGSIRGSSVTGNAHVETSGGNIELRDSDCKLYASTSGGDIRVSLKDNKGIDLSTSGGNVSVRLPKSIAADVDAETTGGDVTCDFEFAGKLKEGSLKGKINGGGNRIRLETSGGDIRIGLTE